MTQEQVNAYARTSCTAISMVLGTTIGFTAAQASALQNGTLGAISLVFLGISLWGTWKAHTEQGLVASAGKVPETKIVTRPEIAEALPSNVTSNISTKVVAK